MLKSALSDGYSSQVRGWLMIDGVQHELAQVGPNFCIIREPLSTDSFVSGDIQAELIIEVDADQRAVAVKLSSSHSSTPRKLQFCRVEAS